MIKIITLTALLCSSMGHSQSINKQHIISSIAQYYNALQGTGNTNSNMIIITGNMSWEHQPTIEQNYYDRYRITLESVLENHWTQVELKHLKIVSKSNDSIIVTGLLSGRQPDECEYISAPFKHVWTLKNATSNQIANNEKSRYHRGFGLH